MKVIARVLIALGLVLAASFVASAGIVVDPMVIGPGANVFDPAGAETVDYIGGGSDAQAVLEARSDLRSIQDFTGFIDNQNIVSFSSDAYPDIQTSVSGNFDPTTGKGIVIDLGTSAGSALQLRSLAFDNSLLTFLIDFGSYDALTQSFDSTAKSVGAAGFTISGDPDSSTAFPVTISYVIDFLDNSGTSLRHVTYTGDRDRDAVSNHADVFVGFNSNMDNISAVRIVRNRTASGSGATSAAPTSYFDDLGFTIGAVPEAGSFIAWSIVCAIAGAMSYCQSRRKRDQH